MYRILVTTAASITYAKEPDGTLATFDHALEAEAWAETWLIGRPGVLSVSLVREAWRAKAAAMRRDLALGRPFPVAT